MIKPEFEDPAERAADSIEFCVRVRRRDGREIVSIPTLQEVLADMERRPDERGSSAAAAPLRAIK